ncbi:MAG: DUF402 domain-containing protein [Lachnospiraceae bacterium]|nr:DUF402 domain-containing protein [Lachnospiraceae bacterium]
MDYPVLYRKRLIPEECVPLKDDEILYMDDDIIVTKWVTLKPRKDFHHGFSCYFLKEGYKVSRFLREDDTLVYWYCDIVTYLWDRAVNSLTVVDLLADVIVKPDGKMNVIDIDELCEAKEKLLINDQQFFISVKQLGALIKLIQDGNFNILTDKLFEHIG